MTTSNLIKGMDISVIQGTIDWKSVVAAGYQFVICRCGVGNSNKDTLYDKNIAGAKAAGLKVMAYNFAYPLPSLTSQPLRDPVKQAQLHAGWANGELAALDLEWPVVQDWAKWGCGAAQIVQWTIAYLEAYEAASGIRPILYSYPSFLSAIKLPADFAQKYKLWIASYTTSPVSVAPWGTDWTLWQSSGGSEKLPNGVAVDIDYARDLSLWDAPVPVAPPSPVVVPPVDNTPPPPVDVAPPPPPPPVPQPVPVVNAPSIWQTIIGAISKLLGR